MPAVQVGEFLLLLLASSNPALAFEASQKLLELTTLLSAQPNSGGVTAVAGCAAAWAPQAIAALMQLWDRQLGDPAHTQLLLTISAHINCLQVGRSICHRFLIVVSSGCTVMLHPFIRQITLLARFNSACKG